jgi:hypothetical protein
MYEAMDFLYAEARAVEEAVFFHTADLLNLDVDLVFYDTTTASFSVDEEDEESDEPETGLRQWGKPKESGWADLRGWKLSRALFVADAGMNSRENRAELGRACGKYLLATRLASVAEIEQEVLSATGSDGVATCCVTTRKRPNANNAFGRNGSRNSRRSWRVIRIKAPTPSGRSSSWPRVATSVI